MTLCTNSYTSTEVDLLVNALNNNFDLKSYKCRQNSDYIIIIPSYSVPKLQTLLTPIMPVMMQHKIGL